MTRGSAGGVCGVASLAWGSRSLYHARHLLARPDCNAAHVWTSVDCPRSVPTFALANLCLSDCVVVSVWRDSCCHGCRYAHGHASCCSLRALLPLVVCSAPGYRGSPEPPSLGRAATGGGLASGSWPGCDWANACPRRRCTSSRALGYACLTCATCQHKVQHHRKDRRRTPTAPEHQAFAPARFPVFSDSVASPGELLTHADAVRTRVSPACCDCSSAAPQLPPGIWLHAASARCT